MKILQCGNCEPLKTGVHASVLGLAAICGLYNAAAWLTRRQTHLAVNAVLYTVLAAWEQQHVTHHLAALRQSNETDVSSGNPVRLVDAQAA
jgi:hypothetical protein